MERQQTDDKSESEDNTSVQSAALSSQAPHGILYLNLPNVALLLFFIILLSISRLYSYLLFHSLVEIFTISISFTILILVYNSRRLLENGYLMILGTGFATSACLDLVHSLAYKGMNIFVGHDANLPTQLWIVARYLQALSLLTAPFACRKRLNLQLIMAFYAAISMLFVGALLSGNFPDCYLEGTGLTRFKIVSEYLIVAMILASMYLLRRIRSSFDESTYRLVMASSLCSVCAEIAFTVYIGVFDFANMAGHFCKLAAYFLIYRALFVTGIREPFSILFREFKLTEQLLREKQLRLDTIIAAASVGTWEWNVQTGETVFNNQWAEIIGYSLDEISPISIETWVKFAHPGDLEASNLRLQEHFRGELEFYDVEVRMRHKDGHWVWVLDRGKVTSWTEDGQPLLMHGTHTDVSHHKLAEQVRGFLAQTSSGTTGEPFFNALARYLAQSLQMDFVCIDRLEGDGRTARTVAVWFDGHFEDNVTYSLKDTPCGDVVGKAFCCFPSGVTQLFPNDEVLKDLRAESYVGVTLQGHTGELIGLIAVIGRRPLEKWQLAEETLQMVAGRAAWEMERQDAEAALRESEGKFRAIFEQAGVGAAIIDSTTGRFLQINKKYANIIGFGVDEMLASRFMDITHPDDLQADLDNMEKLRSGLVFESCVEKRYLHKNGATVWVALTVSPLWLDGSKDRHHIAMVSDITDRKLVEKELKASLKEKDVLLREVHHRVKNNLAAIKGLLDLQREVISDKIAIDSLKDLSDRIVSMALVHERLYRSENMTRIDFQDYLGDLTSQLLTSYGAWSYITCNLDAAGLELSLDMAVPIGLIVNELFTNAVKHAFPAKESGAGGHRCEVLVRMYKDGDVYTLTVADNGVGLPPALDWRDCPSLGLRLVRMLSEYQLGGQMQLDQKEGVCFTILFKDRKVEAGEK